MRSSNISTRSNRRETRSQHNDSNNNRDSSSKINTHSNSSTNNNNNDQQSSTHYDRRKSQQPQKPYHSSAPPSSQQHQQQTYHQPSQHHQQQHQQRSQDYRDRSGQRDRSDQRDRGGMRDRSGQRGGQYPDSSMGARDLGGGLGPAGNLGSVKFTPGFPTRELPPVETKADPSKKFQGRCRLFVGNLPHNTSEEQVKSLFEPFGEIGEIFLGPKSSFAFVKMDTKQNAEAARDALDCSSFDGRQLRVRLAAHAAAIRVKNLSPVVTNELLAYSFRYFGEIERAVVVVDDKGKSIGEGIVEYSKKQSALYAVKRCQQECFMLTASPMPVLVEPYDQHDEDEGLPEKSVNKNSIEFKEQRDVGPRFAEVGTFEHAFAMRWKELYGIENQKRERLEQEIEEARKNLQSQIEYSRLEHDTMQLRNKLQQLEDNRMKLQQMKEQTMTDAQLRDEQRRQQDLMIRQREEEILRRQQLGESGYLGQQEASLRSQAHVMQDMLGSGVGSASVVPPAAVTQQQQQQLQPEQTDQSDQQKAQQTSGMTQEPDTNAFGQTLMGPASRTFADVAMMGMSQQQQQYMQQTQQMPAQLTMAPPPNQGVMYTGYIPPPPIQSSLVDETTLANNQFGAYQQTYNTTQSDAQQQTGQVGGGRPQRLTRSYVNQSNNNIRPRKRGRF